MARLTLVTTACLALSSWLASGCSDDPDALVLEVTADQNARRLRAEIKGPATLPAVAFEFDVDPTGQGRDLTSADDAYELALRFAAAGRYGVHIVDVSNPGPPTQSYAAVFEIRGLSRGVAHLNALGAGDDDDGDGWPESCPAGVSECLRDCNDGDVGTNPFAVDICEDGLDQDCSGADRPCEDGDGDGFPESCPPGDFSCAPDCDDGDPAVNPGVHEAATVCDGSSEPRRCDDGVDNDCDGTDAVCHTDQDCDGYFPVGEPGGDDCDDADPAAHPGAIDVCDDAIDQDCDGTADDGCERCDEDGDGEYGLHPERGCDVAPEQRDCDDSDRAVHHGATTLPAVDCAGNEGAAACALRGYCARPGGAGVDEDCDGLVNEGCPDSACDVDGDGFARASCPTPPPPNLVDCNDDPAAGGREVFPGAPDNCKTPALENCSVALPCANDADGDGYNAGAGDCNDADALVHPWAVDACNGKDDDCDGVTDEGNPTVGGMATLGGAGCTFDDDGQCGAGAPGRCVCSPTVTDGVMDPSGDRTLCPGEVASPWGARCFGAVQPSFEKCDPLDWDCNEIADDPTGANLDPAELGQPCHGLPGPCVAGHVIGCDLSQTHLHYTNPAWVCSSDERGPQAETCNGVNDDCDGAVDEGFNLGTGCDGADGDLCSEGVIQCDLAGATECNDGTGTNVELCNAADDDCDGQLNEGFTNLGQACDGGDTDLCNEGSFVCNVGGTATVCSDQSGNNNEICNGVDDDCDGTTDEGFANLGQPCDGGDTDLCAEGVRVCNGPGTGTTCNDPVGDNDVERCNNADDDCDGATDEDFPTLGQACDGSDTDQCIEGTVVCAPGGLGTVCTDTTGSTTEICNGLDDDCDLTPDDGAGPTCAPLGDTCTTGACRCGAGPLCSTSVADSCSAGACRCGAAGACSPTTSNACTSGVCRCGGAAACSGLSDTCAAGTCRCGMGAACTSATADNCAGGACRCGVGAACSTKSADNCTGGMCRCGANPACTGMADTCAAGTCLCGSGPACDPLAADNCADGACKCGNLPACLGALVCTGGVCL